GVDPLWWTPDEREIRCRPWARGRGISVPRRSFTDDFKASTVRLVLDEGKTVSQVARELDLTASAVRRWVDRARADRTQARPGSPARSGRSSPGCAGRIASCGWSGRS